MSLIENLLFNSDTNSAKNTKSPSSNNGNFLLNLINTYKEDPDKLSDFLKSLNIDTKDLEKLSSDKEDKDSKLIDEIKNILKNSKKELKTEPFEKKETQKPETFQKDENLLAKLIAKPQTNEKLEEKISAYLKDSKDKTKKTDTEKTTKTIDSLQLTTNLETNTGNILSNTGKQQSNIKIDNETLTNITKKIITSSKTLENLKLSDDEISQFKEIKTFKELVDFANKKDLNISKIVLNYTKPEKTENFQQKFKLPKTKISLKQQKTTNSLNTAAKHETQSADILSSLLQKTIQEETKQHEKTADIPQKQHSDNTSSQNSSLISDGFDVKTLKQNITKSKQSIKHFASSLKDAVDSYKPPVSKLTMELHPKELGKVEVTLVHRGDNLQIQINSNNTAVGFLHSQQQELKQNLINMGFTDVNMSFNQNQQQGNKEYRQNQKFANNQNEEGDELIIEIPYQYA
jgi:flagellar hook-length control protein FliK